MLDALNTSMACLHFFLQGNYPPTSKGDVEDGRHIVVPTQGRDKIITQIKSLSIFKVKYYNKTNLMTLRNMDVLSTYVTHSHPCDS